MLYSWTLKVWDQHQGNLEILKGEIKTPSLTSPSFFLQSRYLLPALLRWVTRMSVLTAHYLYILPFPEYELRTLSVYLHLALVDQPLWVHGLVAEVTETFQLILASHEPLLWLSLRNTLKNLQSWSPGTMCGGKLVLKFLRRNKVGGISFCFSEIKLVLCGHLGKKGR